MCCKPSHIYSYILWFHWNFHGISLLFNCQHFCWLWVKPKTAHSLFLKSCSTFVIWYWHEQIKIFWDRETKRYIHTHVYIVHNSRDTEICCRNCICAHHKICKQILCKKAWCKCINADGWPAWKHHCYEKTQDFDRKLQTDLQTVDDGEYRIESRQKPREW